MSKAASQQAELAKVQAQEAARGVLVTTGDVQAKHQPLNIVFAVGSSQGGFVPAAYARGLLRMLAFVPSPQASTVGAHGSRTAA